MIFFLIAVLAGILTVLAPCILPLLPIIIGSSETEGRRISRRSLVVIGSLSFSVILFTLLLKASTLLIDIPQMFWSVFSGTVIILVGLAIIFPSLWTRIPFVQKLSILGNKAIGTGYQKKSYSGDALIGLALGPVFTTCSPTYLFIIATILPAGFLIGFIYLLGFTLGLAISLLLIAYFGGQLVNKITNRMGTADLIKKIFGVLIILTGVAILTGYDKKLETAILDAGYGATINFEESLIEKFSPKKSK
jgi:cytochrome c-type biogenesis protein